MSHTCTRLTSTALAAALLAAVLLLPVSSPAATMPRCTYTIEKTSPYGRVSEAAIYRDGEEVGRIHFNDRSNWYYVRCANGGVDPAETFLRIRDADWAACQRCY